MEINSLYRTYRPKTFAEVIGQDHITQTLINQIKGDRIAHAYLFCGSRGTGKTSVAKIFAREINKNAPNAELDTFEIDAASNNSVQDVRDIIDRVKYPPVGGQYKVYIIDEVHMFSGSAFNAFLKTLEEPPSHVIFILCTTEPHKLIPTVQSRCLRFDFRPVSTALLEAHVKNILTKENKKASGEAVKMLATAGAGSVRDTLSFLETALGYKPDGELAAQDVAQILGSVNTDILEELLTNIIKKDLAKITATVDTIFSRGINAAMLVKNFLDVIKGHMLKEPTKYGNVFRIFSELELAIKNSTDVRAYFENTALLASV